MYDLINKFPDLLRFVPYIKEYKVKIQRLLSCLPQSYNGIIEFYNPKSLNEVFRKAKMCYQQHKQRSETPKSWKDKKEDKLNQWKKSFKPSPYLNMTKGFQRN